jgi:hypothetical protein
MVAMAHPHQMLSARRPHALEQPAGCRDLNLGPAEFAGLSGRNPPAQRLHHRLLAIADAKHRHSGRKNVGRQLRALSLGHAGRPAGKDDAPGLQPLQRRRGVVERHHLAIDMRLAHPARDQLGYLAPEVQDQDGVGGGIG